MSKRSVASYLIAGIFLLFILALASDLLVIHLNLSEGAQVKTSLLASFQTRFPEHQAWGTVTYMRRVTIRVKGTIDKSEKSKIAEFLLAEKEKGDFQIDVWLCFDDDDQELEPNGRNLK